MIPPLTPSFRVWVREHADDPLADPPVYLHSAVRPTALLTEQASWWFTRDDVWVRVVEMEPSHRRAVLSGLRKDAAAWQVQTGLYDPGVDVSGPAEQWIERQPLVARLAALVAADQADPVSMP